ncbi:MAG: DUF393 domain-containing protein [Thermanaerothrix sp.]|nr:DUF393 domain-containing protein [Thermanaerothrix sp.]
MKASLFVFYDGACSLCTRTARLLEKLDWRRHLVVLSFRAPGVMTAYGLDPARAEARLQVQVAGRILEGIAAVEAIAAHLPLLWPLWPWIALARCLGIGDPIYDWIARHRWWLGRHSTCAGTCGPSPQSAPLGDH